MLLALSASMGAPKTAATRAAAAPALSTYWNAKTAVGKSNASGRDKGTIKRQLLNILYTGDLIPE